MPICLVGGAGEMKLKILSIDYRIDDERIVNYSFYESPSFTDYDVLIIDPFYVSNIWDQKKI